MSSNVHETASDGFKEGSHYDKSRPSYTDSIVSRVMKNLHWGHREGAKYDIVELGAGTGKFTGKFLPLLPKETRYLATEPSKEFLDVLKNKLTGVDTQICTCADLPLADNSVQNIICAQCFHWFANIDSLRQIHRVLVPGRRLFLVWNDKDNKNIQWLGDMDKVLTSYYTDDIPRKTRELWKDVFVGQNMFRLVEHIQEPGIQLLGNKDFVVNHFTSISVIAILPESEKEDAVRKYKAVLDKYFDDEKEDICISFVSDFYCTEKI